MRWRKEARSCAAKEDSSSGSRSHRDCIPGCSPNKWDPNRCPPVEEARLLAEVKRVLGQEANAKFGADLGLGEDWVVNIIKGVGNYGEIFDRTIGAGSVLKLERGLNNLWTKGGLMYAAPFR